MAYSRSRQIMKAGKTGLTGGNPGRYRMLDVQHAKGSS